LNKEERVDYLLGRERLSKKRLSCSMSQPRESRGRNFNNKGSRQDACASRPKGMGKRTGGKVIRAFTDKGSLSISHGKKKSPVSPSSEVRDMLRLGKTG